LRRNKPSVAAIDNAGRSEKITGCGDLWPHLRGAALLLLGATSAQFAAQNTVSVAALQLFWAATAWQLHGVMGSRYKPRYPAHLYERLGRLGQCSLSVLERVPYE
jgi:hypothetical protein